MHLYFYRMDGQDVVIWATLKLPWEVSVVKHGEEQESSGGRVKREMATFNNLESYNWRISLAEKWGIRLFPWFGVTFLADHIDNITYTLQGFANETIRGFEYLSNTQPQTLLKHDMALDYILAKQGGLCVTLNLTGDACCTLIPDNSDNMTSVIDALKCDGCGFCFVVCFSFPPPFCVFLRLRQEAWLVSQTQMTHTCPALPAITVLLIHYQAFTPLPDDSLVSHACVFWISLPPASTALLVLSFIEFCILFGFLD